MKAAQLVKAGAGIEGIEVREVAAPEAGPGEVVVDLWAAALNRRDYFNCLGADPGSLPATLGSDGVIINPALRWGDREDAAGPEFDILGVPTNGTLAARVVVPAENVTRKPSRLSWEDAAALNLAGLTAWRALVTCARLERGHTVLVTGAGSGVSTFLVQIAAALGARVFVTSGSAWKTERAMALGALEGFDYNDPGWPEAVREAVGGDGLDAVIDSSGGDTWRKAIPALRRGGKLVVFGRTVSNEAPVNVRDLYWHWRSIIGTTMGSPREYRALITHVEHATWCPVIDSTFDLADVRAAFERLNSGERFGKVVVRPAQD